jgi:hypothetical protein
MYLRWLSVRYNLGALCRCCCECDCCASIRCSLASNSSSATPDASSPNSRSTRLSPCSRAVAIISLSMHARMQASSPGRQDVVVSIAVLSLSRGQQQRQAATGRETCVFLDVKREGRFCVSIYYRIRTALLGSQTHPDVGARNESSSVSAVFANKFWRPRPLPPRVPARFRIRFARARPARGRVGLSGRREMGHTIANFSVIIHVSMIEILNLPRAGLKHHLPWICPSDAALTQRGQSRSPPPDRLPLLHRDGNPHTSRRSTIQLHGIRSLIAGSDTPVRPAGAMRPFYLFPPSPLPPARPHV